MADGIGRPLSEDAVIQLGGWDRRFARVLLIEQSGEYALVLVDGNGDGAELEVEYWRDGGGSWHCEASSGFLALGSLTSAETWNTGEYVCAVGRVAPGSVVGITYGDHAYSRQANEFGVWGFVHETDSPHTGELPVTAANFG